MIGTLTRKCPVILMAVAIAFLGKISQAESPYKIAAFQADVTIPIGHRCMGVLPIKATEVVDPLQAHGFLLTGLDKPIVFAAIDWCEIRNGAYDQWRDELAKAASTDRQHVIVSCLHQHDAPVTDSGAQHYLNTVGLTSELYDASFHQECISRVAEAIIQAKGELKPITQIGVGQAEVRRVGSSRRVVSADGKIKFNRYSKSAGDPFLANAPDGEIDPFLKTITFWNHEKPMVAIHCYATHPMSYYGKGQVSADFVGIARRRFQRQHPDTHQIYATGCSGDVTAGKYNDGAPATRAILAERIVDAMSEAWDATQKHPVSEITFRNTTFQIPFHNGDDFRRAHLMKTLSNDQAKTGDRILAAMGLSSLDRLKRKQPIDMPCLDLGAAQIVLFPGEAFVGYQLMAQEMSPKRPVMSIGYGECWPGYIPTAKAFQEGFGHGWRWSEVGSEASIRAALSRVLR